MPHHALVFGASGILGWAIVNEILNNYPNAGTYYKVTALTNRPLSRQDALWPESAPGMPELNIVSGIDLTKGTVEEVKKVMKERVPGIETVTHVFYFAYLFHPDFPSESEINLGMMQRGFGAVESMAPNLEYVIFPTGTKGYGVHIPNDGGFKAPYLESMGEIPNPYRDELFYYVLRDEFTKMQQGKAWKWAEVRCDIVYGFVPHSNPYNVAAVYMNFLSLYTYMHQGHPDAIAKQVPFPSASASYHSLSNDGGQDIFARFSIHLCLNLEKAGTGELYNIADEATPRSMADRWSYACSLFGLEGVPPIDTSDPKYTKAVHFIKTHADQVKSMEEEKGVTLQVVNLDEIVEIWMESFDFDHGLMLEKARGMGFVDELSYRESWRIIVGRYARAKKAYLGR